MYLLISPNISQALVSSLVSLLKGNVKTLEKFDTPNEGDVPHFHRSTKSLLGLYPTLFRKLYDAVKKRPENSLRTISAYGLFYVQVTLYLAVVIVFFGDHVHYQKWCFFDCCSLLQQLLSNS